MTDTITEHADDTLEAGETLIEMVDVGKSYGAIRALRGVNMKVRAGEVTCVLGDNGAGKSTLIKIISGLHPHNEGVMKVDGNEVEFSNPRRRSRTASRRSTRTSPSSLSCRCGATSSSARSCGRATTRWLRCGSRR